MLAALAGAVGGALAGAVRAGRDGAVPRAQAIRWAGAGGALAAVVFLTGAAIQGFFYFLSGPKPPGPILAITLGGVVLGSVLLALVPTQRAR